MGTFDESFGEELSKLAQIVETIDSSFLKNGDVTVNIKLTERDYINLTQKLGNGPEDKKCTISIENINFIFSRM
jgi:hypothetical protein